MAIDSINTRAIVDITTIAQTNRSIQHWRFALLIADDCTEELSLEHLPVERRCRQAACVKALRVRVFHSRLNLWKME
jgi:hypothetical protein